jgi:subtilisin
VQRAVQLGFLVLAAWLASAASAQPHAGGGAPLSIVVLADGVDVDAKVAALAVEPRFVYRHALRGFSAVLTRDQAAALRADVDVAFVQPDGPVHVFGTDPLEPGEVAPTGIRRIEAATPPVNPNRIQKKGKGKIAVIDSGLDFGHTDLNVADGKDCINAPPAQDDNGHGTFVAGTVGARNTGAGIVGVSPGSKLVAVKVVDASGAGTFASLICGVDWVTANEAQLKITVATFAIGGQGSDDGNCGNSNGDALHKAICASVAAGVTYVVSAGSSAGNFASIVPAAYDEVLTVTAMADLDGIPGGLGGGSDDRVAPFSNFAVSAADQAHTIAGPGVNIFSTWLGNEYRTQSGTSFSAAHVAGVVAICLGHKGMRGRCAGKTPAQIIQQLRADAAAKPPSYGFDGDPNHPMAGRYYGFLVTALPY